MRIGIDATLLRAETRYTGMGQYTQSLLAGIDGVGCAHDITLLGYDERPADAPAHMEWYQLERLPLGKLGPWISHQLQVARAVRSLGLDLLHVPGVYLRLSGPGVPLSVPCPLVVTLHDAIPLTYYAGSGRRMPWRLRFGFRVALAATRRAAAIITVSETSRRDIERHVRVRPNQVHVIYCGIEFPPPPDRTAAQRSLQRLGIQAPYILYAGSYEPRKNVLGAVAAYRLARETCDLPPMVLLVERDSGWRTEVMGAVAQSGVADRLHFVHSLPDADLAALYYQASLFVYPSRYEGFGLPPAQALAAGLPVIASSAGSLPEILGDAACYVDPYSVPDLAATLVRLHHDTALAQAFAARGPAQAARYRWSDAARATISIYEAVGRRTLSRCTRGR